MPLPLGSAPIHMEKSALMGPRAPRSGYLQAGLVFPISTPPIPDGALFWIDGVIRAVGTEEAVRRCLSQAGTSVPEWRFPQGALLPGFVNAHTHLELSAMLHQIPRPGDVGEDFTGWIRRLLAIREQWTHDKLLESAWTGARLSIRSGVTLVGDIAATGVSLEPLIKSGLRAVVFREALGSGPERLRAASHLWQEWLNRSGSVQTESRGRVRLGLSPHAPHSTAAPLYAEAVRLARRSGCLLSTHISETLDELEFIRSGTGVFRHLLAARSLPLDAWSPAGVSPVHYLDQLDVWSVQGLAVHLNYPEPGDLEILEKSSATVTYCPRSHAFFGHTNHPAPEILDSGMRLVLGTDSLASADSLSMLDELRELQRIFPQRPLEPWIRATTLDAARALGMGDLVGSLEPGKSADLCLVELPDVGTVEPGAEHQRTPSTASPVAGEAPERALLKSGARVTGTAVAGNWLFGPESHTPAHSHSSSQNCREGSE